MSHFVVSGIDKCVVHTDGKPSMKCMYRNVMQRQKVAHSSGWKMCTELFVSTDLTFFSKNGVDIMADELATNRNNKNAFQ